MYEETRAALTARLITECLTTRIVHMNAADPSAISTRPKLAFNDDYIHATVCGQVSISKRGEACEPRNLRGWWAVLALTVATA